MYLKFNDDCEIINEEFKTVNEEECIKFQDKEVEKKINIDKAVSVLKLLAVGLGLSFTVYQGVKNSKTASLNLANAKLKNSLLDKIVSDGLDLNIHNK